jgi:hypothetical protein
MSNERKDQGSDKAKKKPEGSISDKELDKATGGAKLPEKEVPGLKDDGGGPQFVSFPPQFIQAMRHWEVGAVAATSGKRSVSEIFEDLADEPTEK